MTSKIAQGYLETANESVEGAHDALARGNLAHATIEAQIAVEMSVKAALLGVGLEPPKKHGLQTFLLRHRSSFPANRQAHVREWAEAMGELTPLRDPASYGDPESGKTAREMFSDKNETERLVQMAHSVFDEVRQFLRKVKVAPDSD
jgi:HEPN domain-containing protein